MGNILDELTNVTAIACEDCNGAGFIFFGEGEEYDVMQCDCIDEPNLFLTKEAN